VSVLELVADHFEQPERWPTVDPELWEPARLCVPNCFALNVAEHFVGTTRPARHVEARAAAAGAAAGVAWQRRLDRCLYRLSYGGPGTVLLDGLVYAGKAHR
jgi:hypothetical protein